MPRGIFTHIDWVVVLCAVLLSCAGLVTIYSFSGDNALFEKQIIWLFLAIFLFFAVSFADYRFLRRTEIVTGVFASCVLVLLGTLLLGATFQGASRWIDLGLFTIQPSDPAKLVVIIVLAKYFSRRHVEIAHIRHVIISGLYAALIALLVFLQPDFGSAIIIGVLWFGMILVSGISKKHLALVLGIGVCVAGLLWVFVLADYQKQRVQSFLNPYTDMQGAGYNARQATIAVGSGQLWGKGIGYGTQSRLKFLPEYETDFMFAAFAEEWGLVGSCVVLLLYGCIVWRVMQYARVAAGNFEMLFSYGVALLLVTHVTMHVGINIGLLPVTGTTIPFMSYGGSHVLTEFAALGILMGMRQYSRVVPQDAHGSDVAVDVIPS